jgi:hypothetical protein
MATDNAKEHYQERLMFCRNQAFPPNDNSREWLIAAEVYEHLRNCPLTHSVDKDGNPPTCRWQSEPEQVFSLQPSSSDGTQSTS